MRDVQQERAGWDEVTRFDVAARWLARRYGRGFSEPSLTLGLEEELILVDPVTLLPANEIEWVLAQVGEDGCFRAELRASQVELRTPICLTAADACRELAWARGQVVGLLTGRSRVVAAGTHPVSTDEITVTARDRYQQIASECAWATRRGQPSGLHVHVGVGDPGEALAVYNVARSYLPELAALAANSPFFEGRESGLASTRLKLTEELPRSGIPPAFSSWDELARFAAWGRAGGVFSDLSYLWWDLRPRPDYGTLEFRIMDVQTRCTDTGALAAVCQTLVAALAVRLRRGDRLPVHATHMLSENRWRAMRDGLDATLVDLDTGATEPVRERLGRLLFELEPYADELGCGEELAHTWSLLEGNGATRQREIASRRGMPGLIEWLADESEPPAAAEDDELLLEPAPALARPEAAATGSP